MTVNAPNPAPQPVPSQPVATPPKKGLGILGCILIGCGVLALLALIVIGVVVYIGYRAAKELKKNPVITSVFEDTDLAKRKPELAAAKFIVLSNPDMEIVKLDESENTITVHNKKTGDTVTMDASKIKSEGKFSFESVDVKGNKTTTTFGGKEGKEMYKVESKDGTTTLGNDAVWPDWLSKYPGAETTAAGKVDAPESRTDTFTLTIKEAPAAASDKFKELLKQAGLKEATAYSAGADKDIQISLIYNDETRVKIVTVGLESNPDTGGSKASVMIQQNKK